MAKKSKTKLEHTDKEPSETIRIKLISNNSGELSAKVIPRRGYRDSLIESLRHSNVF